MVYLLRLIRLGAGSHSPNTNQSTFTGKKCRQPKWKSVVPFFCFSVFFLIFFCWFWQFVFLVKTGQGKVAVDLWGCIGLPKRKVFHRLPFFPALAGGVLPSAQRLSGALTWRYLLCGSAVKENTAPFFWFLGTPLTCFKGMNQTRRVPIVKTSCNNQRNMKQTRLSSHQKAQQTSTNHPKVQENLRGTLSSPGFLRFFLFSPLGQRRDPIERYLSWLRYCCLEQWVL